MAVTKKIIGRIPICFGTWYAKQGGWGIKNRVTLYGSEFESLHENNTVSPAVYNEIENTVSMKTIGGLSVMVLRHGLLMLKLMLLVLGKKILNL